MRAETAPLPGCVDVKVKSVYGAHSYVFERCISENPEGASAVWQEAGTSTKSNHRITGLPSMTYVYIRVRAVGSSGYSDPSEVVSCLVA